MGWWWFAGGGVGLPEVLVLGEGRADAGFDRLERGFICGREGGALAVAGILGLGVGSGG